VYFTFAGPTGDDLFEIDSWSFTPASDGPALAVSATAGVRCFGRNAQLVIDVTNDAPARITGTVSTGYGEKEYGVAPATSKVRTFPTGGAVVPAGTATVTASARVNGEPVSVSLDVSYAAHVCD